MAFTDQVAALAVRIGQEIKALRATISGPPSTQTGSGALSIDCQTNSRHAISMTGSITNLSVTGTPTDGQRLFVELYAPAGTNRAFNTTLANATPRALPFSVVAGTVVLVGLYYSSRLGAWIIGGVAVP